MEKRYTEAGRADITPEQYRGAYAVRMVLWLTIWRILRVKQGFIAATAGEVEKSEVPRKKSTCIYNSAYVITSQYGT